MMTAAPAAALEPPQHPASRDRRTTGGFSRLYATGLALTAFGAVYQPSFLGYLAASPGVLLIAISLLMLAPLRSLRDPSVRDTRRLLAWGLVASVPSVLFFGVNPAYLAKTFTLLILSTIWLSPLLCVPRLHKQHLSNGLAAALVICAIGYLVGDVFRGSLPSFLNGLIFGGDYANYEILRPRAFMQENSHFATLVGRYLIAFFLLYEANRRYSARRLGWFIALLTLLLAVLDSKGAAISALAAAIAVGMTRKLLPFFILLLPLFSWLVLKQVDVVLIDIENFTSASTRATLLLSTLAGAACNPLGYGFYGFYGAVQAFGGWSMDWLGERVPLLLTEVADIVEELNNVSTKSTLMDFTLIFGVPFLFMLWRLAKRCHLSDPRAKAALVYTLLSAMSTSGHESISCFLILAILVRWYPKRSPDGRLKRAPKPCPPAQLSLRASRPA
ncbi:hypothetical protein [Pelomonas cellulosilytica]|uniref:O-antigen ligase like membrane protein n=1 Tax=Pelomonas cellulosilytica TaxID=2906762 RepID=A0ABS8Y606_9BURK|nr:hypothetical protein [Pelomonas sp. P8]MCE4558045.1 hypothetical protein [Pelomonas sp. P8]